MKRITYILIGFTTLILTGCSGFLDKAPVLSQSTEITMSNYTGLSKAVAGAYTPLFSTTWYGADFILDAEMRSGNGSRNDNYSSNRYTQPYNWNYSEDNTPGLWGFGYYVISAANNVLANLEDKTSSEVSDQDINNLKAECLFLRALSHFNMVLYYAQPYSSQPESLGIPVVLVTDPAGKPARNTVKEVYDQIVTDLLEAESIIDPDFSREGVVDAKASVSLGAIQALLSRVYLYMEDWQKAADYATKVISSKKYKMWTASEYPTVWGAETAGDGEVIFEVYGKKTNGYFGSWSNISWVVLPEGYADTQASPDLTNLYADGDIRMETYKTDSKGESNLLWTAKYPGKGDGTPDANNTIVLRLSEMYLNRAEAAVNGAQTGSSAVADLNTITSNRNAVPYTSVGRADIVKERRLELAWEGHFIFDLARWKMPVSRTYFTGEDNQNVEFPSYRWALPIPKRELEVNENLVQNEGY